MSDTTDEKSPAIQLLDFVSRNARANPRRAFGNALSAALGIAIRGGMKFGLEDFATISRSHRYNPRCDGHDAVISSADSAEHSIYRTAIEANNESACKAFECWRGRAPFFVWDDTAHRYDRVHVGSGVRLFDGVSREGDHHARVSSFCDDGEHLIAVAEYKDAEGKDKRRQYKLARPDLLPPGLDAHIAARKAQKKAEKAVAQACEAAKGNRWHIYWAAPYRGEKNPKHRLDCNRCNIDTYYAATVPVEPVLEQIAQFGRDHAHAPEPSA